MLNKKERMEKLNQAGVNTEKYFSVELPNGLNPGAKISLIINENGEPMMVTDDYDENTVMSPDYIANQIIEDGYVRNTKLHRRFVMAQMFAFLNYQSWDRTESGYHACLRNRYGYDYTLTMMLEEVRVLSKLEARDKESFEERSHFFTKDVVVAVLEDYLDKVKEYVEHLPSHKCKGVPYKKIKGVNIFNDDINKKVYRPIVYDINRIKSAKSYSEIYRILSGFMKNRIKLNWKTSKSKVWIDAYKGEGAYYTLKNLVMFHNCSIIIDKYDMVGREAVNYINEMLDEYQGEGWRMFALMKKVIEDNDFDFYAKMKEIYSE